MKKRYLLNSTYISASVILGFVLVSMLNGSNIFSKFIFATALCIAASDSFLYALSGHGLWDTNKSVSRLPVRYIFILFGLLLLFYSPLFTNGFLFHDDYINFAGVSGGNSFFEFTMTQGRQATGLLTDLMNYVTVQNSWHLRIFAVTGIVLYALVIAQTFYKLGMTPVTASGIALILSVLTPVINVAAYGSMFCYPLAFVFSARGILCFWDGVKQNCSTSSKFVYILFGGFLIVLSNFVYQATATVAFPVILMLYLYDKETKMKHFPLQATISYVFFTGIYYVAIKIISSTQSANLMGRASIVSSVNEIINKIIWFGTVFTENLKQLASSFIGSKAFLSPWMHYLLSFKNSIVETLSIGLLLVLLLAGLARVFKNMHIWGLIQVLVMFPLSYYVFLILSESSYTSYYSVALCSTMLIVIIYALESICNTICQKIRIKANIKQAFILYISGIFIFGALLNGNYYINHFWVDYNSYGYNFLKQDIQQNYEGQNRIHVIGSLYPGQADVYATSAARIASRELGLPYGEITFTSSSNAEYINPLTLEIYNEMLSVLSEEDQQMLSSCYIIDYNFSICSLDPNVMSEDKYRFLTEIFNKTGVIPSKNDESTLIVDIQGINDILVSK